MKYILILLLLATSCTKQQPQTCYTCSVTLGPPQIEYCGDIKDFHPKDSNGNELQYFCTPK